MVQTGIGQKTQGCFSRIKKSGPSRRGVVYLFSGLAHDRGHKEEETDELPKTRWAIDLAWFQQNDRSISVLIKGYLCPNCAKKFSTGEKEHTPKALMSAIKSCCSRAPDFINERLPILEGIFRLFLSKGNQPLDLEELGNHLSQLRGGDPYRSSPDTLSRLLKSDRYYGFQEIKE